MRYDERYHNKDNKESKTDSNTFKAFGSCRPEKKSELFSGPLAGIASLDLRSEIVINHPFIQYSFSFIKLQNESQQRQTFDFVLLSGLQFPVQANK